VPTLSIVLVIITVAIAVAAFLVRKKNRETDVARAEELRAQAATQAESTIAPAQEHAAEAEADAEQARPEAADHAPQVPSTADPDGGRAPLLPRRTPGANEMPGKPIEQTDGGGGWFTKDSGRDPDRS
jgi:type II secretory pathway pseudopilin PulG